MTPQTPPPPGDALRSDEPPEHLAAGGLRLWHSVVDLYDLDEHERALLVRAARCVDLCDRLDALVERDGPMLDGRAHPAAVEARLQGITLARLLAGLRLPAGTVDDQQASARPQRRSGYRGTHALRALDGGRA